MKNKKVGYKELIKFLDDDDKECIQKVFCEDALPIPQIAEDYQTSPAVMRRIIMELFGDPGYAIAKNQRKFVNKKNSKWKTQHVKHGRQTVLYDVIKLLLDTDKTYFAISKEVGCSRERVGQIAENCLNHKIKLNEKRNQNIQNSKYYETHQLRGYSKVN